MPGGQYRNALPAGHMLMWYRIDSVLGQGGFGITYRATDTKIDHQVAIKEYLPIDLAIREPDHSIQAVADDREDMFGWGLGRFLDEAKTLARFKHPNIVRVLFYTEANNTGYMVMEYEQGESLEAKLRRGERFDETQTREIALPLLDGLNIVHEAGFIHRDIKPANIYIRSDGSPVLLDFGSARQSFAGHTKTLTTLVSPGYAPFEQYHSDGERQGPWTDIYAMGATLYRMVTGNAPPDAIARSAGLQDQNDPIVPAAAIVSDRYSADFLQAIDTATAFRERDRPQSIEAWQALFNGEIVVPDDMTFDMANAPTQVVDGPMSPVTVRADPAADTVLASGKISHRRRWMIVAGIVLLILFTIMLLNAGDEEIVEHEPPALLPDIHEETLIGNTPAPQPLTQKEQINELLHLAQNDLEHDRLTLPEGRNALQRYRAILDIEPDNPKAIAGIGKIARQYRQLAMVEVDNKRYEQALEYLNRAAGILDLDLPTDVLYQAQNSKLAQQISKSRKKLRKAIEKQNRKTKRR